ncbi:MAG: starch-binding protein [Prevotella sp.]|nr:starch-binding protein [Prevotella sp.]
MNKRLLWVIMLWLSVISSYGSTSYVDNFTGGRTDFRDETIYFMMTTRFYDGDSSNNVLCWDNQDSQISTKDPCWCGDFKGVIDKLDYIKALGFTAIWITPVVQNGSGYDYHGYHAMDFSRVDSRYLSRKDQGSAEDVDFQSLIDAAHAKGIKIVLDIVLNHTGNFGEAHLMPEFTRSDKITAQGSAEACLTPNTALLDNGFTTAYADLAVSDQYQRRLALMKNTDGLNHDTNNYWHHVANSWNWDEPTRWWGQIAGDCVDLNTENDAVAQYLVRCYGQFIKMGVDGFRIDTSGHISPLTFNRQFIPQFAALGEQYASKRLLPGETTPSPFFMYGEVCARFGGVTYRNQPILSPYYYTWTSPSISQWANSDSTWWASQVVKEGADPLGAMTVCADEASASYAQDGSQRTSSNAFLNGNSYRTLDYSQNSGFNVIDFPVHYNFTNVASAMGMATGGDQYYNDATWNVVYVDSHDYGPQPSDNIRFSGGTDQWAENLTWMFLFRGIPCIYYGSEVEFMKGATIDNGTNGPLNNTGRAYFGQNLEGTVTASDFGQFSATGQVSKTLNHPLAMHLERLNRIRQAVPALRKGQYSTDGCSASGGYAWKKRYTNDSIDSYALVCMNGGATFTGILNGTYTDCVTGDVQTVTSGTLTVSSPTNQGNARIYVLNGPGQIGSDGPFLYASSAASADNSDLATDPGTTWNDIILSNHPSLTLSPNGGTFKTDTLDVTLMRSYADEGWYQIGDGPQVAITDSITTVTLGADMAYGDTVTLSWSVTDTNDSTTETVTGQATYQKIDPSAAITVYVKASTAPNLYAWTTESGTVNVLNGAWPGTALTTSTTIGTDTWYTYATTEASSLNVIFNNGSSQTSDITGITSDAYFIYDGTTGYEDVTDSMLNPDPVITSVTITPSTDQMTYCSTQSLDFSQVSGLTPYIIASYYNSDDELQMVLSPVSHVPAGTGVVLKGTAGQTYDVALSTATASYDNLLVGVSTATTLATVSGSYTNMVFDTTTFGFEPLNDSLTLSAGQAYLPILTSVLTSASGNAKRVTLVFDDSTTGIRSLDTLPQQATEPWYTLEGVRVSSPTAKGVYIHRGRKVVVR